MLNVWIDADACHAKAEIVRVCKRYGIVPRLVSNKAGAEFARRRDAESVIVPGAFDAADNHIIAHLRPGDLVLTGDIPLAARVLKAGGAALDFRGRWFTDDNIGGLLATRDLKRTLRQTGALSEAAGGPRAPGPAERAALLQQLNNFLDRASRAAPRKGDRDTDADR